MKSVKEEKSSQESKGFNGKPVDLPSQDTPSMINPPGVGPVSVDRVIPQNLEAGKETAVEKMLPQKTAQVDTLTHRVAWQRFLQKMKSELGVSAEDILKAFQKLSPEELAQPPEKNLTKLVQLLGLNPEQSQIASNLFADLMQKTGARPLGQELARSNKDISLTVMSQREQEQKKMNQALAQMNDKFFMKDAATGTAATATATVGTAGATPMITQQLQSGTAVSPELLAQMTGVDEKQAKQILQKLVEDKQQGQRGFPLVAEVSSGTDASSSAVAPAASTPKDTLTQMFEKSLNAQVQAQGEHKPAAKEKSSSDDAGSQGDAEVVNLPLEGLGNMSLDKSAFQKSLLGGAMMAGASVKGQDAVTPEDLIQKAQVMVRQGGGDVKMVLQPEGLGEVAMKVKVDGDKVQVEMITESDVAKKMIEKGMADLKAHLHASNLSLESLKIDTASNMGHQLEQQYQDAQRQQAQNFMQQFNQSNQNFRRGLFEMPGARIYQSQTDRNGQDVGTVEPTPRKKEGSRLNLVA